MSVDRNRRRKGMNRYMITLRNGSEHYVEAVRVEHRGELMILFREKSVAAVFSEPELKSVTLVAENIDGDGKGQKT